MHPRVRVFRSMRRAFRLVPGTRYRVPAIWHLGPGTRHRSQSDAEGRTPSTEDRARPPENPHTGYASCIVHPVSCIHYIHEVRNVRSIHVEG